MYALEYLIYQLRPYGTAELESRPSTPEPPPDLDLTATPWVIPEESTTQTSTTEETTATNNSSSTILETTSSPPKQT